MSTIKKNKYYLTIKEWSENDRPREKLINKGSSTLTDAELLAILIGSGYQNTTAIELSKNILNNFDNDLSNFAKCSVEELINFKGIGEAKAVSIISALELSRRRINRIDKNNLILNSSLATYSFMKPHLCDKQVEEFWIILLNNNYKFLKIKRISLGGISKTYVDPRVIFKEALNSNSVNIILVHNHPSGKISPSKSDIELTNKLKSGGAFLDINISDHIIFADNSYYSFSDNNLL